MTLKVVELRRVVQTFIVGGSVGVMNDEQLAAAGCFGCVILVYVGLCLVGCVFYCELTVA